MNEKQLKAVMAQIVRENAKRLAEQEEQEAECARCGQWVLPSKHGSFGCGGN
jgi:Zn finger protein HypA/HybF involved in hydrogenase expression